MQNNIEKWEKTDKNNIANKNKIAQLFSFIENAFHEYETIHNGYWLKKAGKRVKNSKW